MSYFSETMGNLLHQTAFFNLTWGNFVMIIVVPPLIVLHFPAVLSVLVP